MARTNVDPSTRNEKWILGSIAETDGCLQGSVGSSIRVEGNHNVSIMEQALIKADSGAKNVFSPSSLNQCQHSIDFDKQLCHFCHVSVAPHGLPKQVHTSHQPSPFLCIN